MKKNTCLSLLAAIIILGGTLTACEKNTAPTQPTETPPTHAARPQPQKKEDSFAGPFYGTIRKVDSASIEIEVLTIENEQKSGTETHQDTNGGDSHKLDQQAKKSDNPADFKANGETISAAFAPTFQVSNAGKTVLDLKAGDMIMFYTSGSGNEEIVSVHIMG